MRQFNKLFLQIYQVNIMLHQSSKKNNTSPISAPNVMIFLNSTKKSWKFCFSLLSIVSTNSKKSIPNFLAWNAYFEAFELEKVVKTWCWSTLFAANDSICHYETIRMCFMNILQWGNFFIKFSISIFYRIFVKNPINFRSFYYHRAIHLWCS